MPSKRKIGTLSEWSLHAELKKFYQSEGAKLEVEVDGFIIDVVQDDFLLEIQTRSFRSIKKKLGDLMKRHKVRLVHPIAVEKTVVRQSLDGKTVIGQRKSPKKMGPQNIFEELVSIPSLIHHQNFSIEVVLVETQEIRQRDGKGSWRRRGWSIVDRKLVRVLGRRVYETAEDFLHFIPDEIEEPFTNSDLVEATGYKRRIAEKITYCLRKMGVLKLAGKRGRSNLHVIRPRSD